MLLEKYHFIYETVSHEDKIYHKKSYSKCFKKKVIQVKLEPQENMWNT